MFRLHASSSYLINLTGPPLHQEAPPTSKLAKPGNGVTEQKSMKDKRLYTFQGIDRLFKTY